MTEQDWAIVIGIWDYPDLGDLSGPENDAKAFAEWVQSPNGGGVPAEHLRLLLSSDFEPAEVAREAEPTDGQVQALFDELDDFAQANKERGEGLRVGRRLYLYMAGHGCAPLLDESVLLMANATKRRAGYHIPGKPWANWFYRAGYFDELLLFMDCCRESYPQAPLNIPAYVDVTAQDAVDTGRRFFAFGTKWSRLSRERPMADGVTRGVFTAALLKGLEGAAAEADGRITASSLAGYLHTGMKTFLSDADLADPEIPKVPDFEIHPAVDPDFVIAVVTPAEPPSFEMQPAVRTGQARLTVEAGDAATEIALIDEGFHIAAQNTGRLENSFTPGRYRIQVRAGEAIHEEIVVLRTGEQTARVFPPLPFASPVPLAHTALTGARHRDAAIARSREIHVRAGEGSQIFVLARDWTAQGRQPTAREGAHPARGLALLDAEGEPITDLETPSWSDLEQDPVTACTIAVDPGLYRLSLQTPEGRLEQTVVAAKGWQTQVFLLQRAQGDDPGAVRADLAGAAMLMADLARDERFDPDAPEQRLVELTRLGLRNRRPVLSPAIREILRADLANPMLGLFAGHLLLLDAEPDLALLRTVVDALRDALAPLPHPDVEALALRLESGDSRHIFTAPPMLRRSWALMLEATVARPELVPAGSLASVVADRLWGVEPWLIWQTAPASGEPELSFGLPSERSPEPDASEIEVALRRQLATPARSAGAADVEFGLEAAGGEAAAQPDEATIRRLVTTLGLPRARVEEMLAETRTPHPQPFSPRSGEKGAGSPSPVEPGEGLG